MKSCCLFTDMWLGDDRPRGVASFQSKLLLLFPSTNEQSYKSNNRFRKYSIYFPRCRLGRHHHQLSWMLRRMRRKRLLPQLCKSIVMYIIDIYTVLDIAFIISFFFRNRDRMSLYNLLKFLPGEIADNLNLGSRSL